ncbi:MAG: hypothetical protein Q9159_000516 [Coniocarpon cinnabarinum]
MFKNALKKLNPLAPDGLSSPRSGFLFPSTDPHVDGEECLHDCETCTVHYPRRFQIEETHQIYGNIDKWTRHLIVATGKHDWRKHVEDEKGSVMEAVGWWKDEHGSKGDRLMLSASNIPLPDAPDAKHISTEESVAEQQEHGTVCLLLPSFTLLSGVTPDNVTKLLSSSWFRASAKTTDALRPSDVNDRKTSVATPSPRSRSTSTPISPNAQHASPSAPSPSTPPTSPGLPGGITATPYPHDYLILLCSQKTRDARCGQSAPLLKREFERQLRPLGLYRDLDDDRPGGVGIVFVSHVGGHKYSANCLIYRTARAVGREERWRDEMTGDVNGKSVSQTKTDETPGDLLQGVGVLDEGAGSEAAQCIWLARVFPEDCENIVRFTVLQGKVVKPARQLRGGFDRQNGLVSW